MMLEVKPPFKLTSLQLNLISLFLVGAAMLVLLVAGIGYRDSQVGLFAVGGLGAAGLGALIFFRPQVGTYILVITIFTNMSAIFTDLGLPGINKPLVALTLVSVVAARYLRRRSFQLKRVEWFLLAYGGVWLTSTFVARDRGISFEHVVDFAKEFFILLCIVYSLESQATWKRAIWLVILSAAALAALGTYQVISGNFTQTFWGFAVVTPDVTQMRLSGPIGDPNFYGQTLLAVLPLALYRLLDEKKLRLKLVAAISLGLLVFIILNTYSRGAFLGLVVVLTLTLIERRIKLSTILMIILAASFIMPLLLPFLPHGFTERIQTLSVFASEDATVHQEASFRGRTSEMISALMMFVEHPFLGIGVGNYEANYQDYARRLGLEYRTEERQAHSLYLEIIAETGSFGLIAFIGLFMSLIAGLYKTRRQSKRFDPPADWSTWLVSLQIGVIAYLTTSIFLHGDFIRYLWLLVALGATAIHITGRLTVSVPSQLPAERISPA